MTSPFRVTGLSKVVRMGFELRDATGATVYQGQQQVTPLNRVFGKFEFDAEFEIQGRGSVVVYQIDEEGFHTREISVPIIYVPPDK